MLAGLSGKPILGQPFFGQEVCPFFFYVIQNFCFGPFRYVQESKLAHSIERLFLRAVLPNRNRELQSADQVVTLAGVVHDLAEAALGSEHSGSGLV